MRNEVRRKIEMGSRVREFSRAQPSDDPGHTILIARLEDRLTRADVLAVQERSGRTAEQAATLQREELRRSMEKRLLRHLVRAGELAARDNPDLVGKFRLRLPNATHRAFLVSSKVMLAEAGAHRELLMSQGMSEVMLGELGKAVAQFEVETDAGNAGRRAHIGARYDLEAIAAEVVQVVGTLDTFNSHRFARDPELLGAWSRARTVMGPAQVRHRRQAARPPVVPAEAVDGKVTPPGASEAPAA